LRFELVELVEKSVEAADKINGQIGDLVGDNVDSQI